ncbi:MAG: archaetidylserine decarboxylase [Gammaproteobacteria bacterium]|nr:archaetidylserine decarboxylase [Gammaproteobacteria bacterium]
MASLRSALYAALPQHALSRLGARFARWRAGPLTTIFIRWFVRRYQVNLNEAAEPDPAAYRSFHAFFTRALAEDARAQPDDPAAVASPVDGVVSAGGRIYEDTIFQAKGLSYFATTLLGSAEAAARYRNGHFITLYLRPCDYHRVHVPLAGELQHIRHLPGRLWPVRPWAVAGVERLFARNERAVLEFSSDATAYALVMVGALMVGGLETRITGPMRRRCHAPEEWNLEMAPARFERGEEFGRFNFGSTVILLFPYDSVKLDATLVPGSVCRLGQSLGRTST